MRRRDLILALPILFIAAPALAEAQRQRGGGESYIQLRAVNVNVRRANGRFGILTADVGLDVPDAALRARVEALQPRLLADFAALLQTYAAGLRPGEPPNPDVAAARLQRSVNTTLRARGATVLLGGLLIN